ncbi:hypothetical protein ACFL1S_06985 [Pseudomonadota bacterium]
MDYIALFGVSSFRNDLVQSAAAVPGCTDLGAAKPNAWRFRTGSPSGSGVFKAGNDISVSTSIHGVESGDLEGDGTLKWGDPDDDDDGVPDADETGGGADNPHDFDPDRGNDGIIDGLDPDPDTADNSPIF